MNKAELVKAVAGELELTQKEVTAVVEATFATIADTMAEGEEVSIPNFGKFVAVTKAARECRNPQTGETFMSEEHMAPKFKPSSVLKEQVK